MDGKAVLWKNANKTTTSPWSVAALETIYANYETQWDKSCVEKRVQTISFSTNCSIPPHGKKRKLCCRKFLLSLWDLQRHKIRVSKYTVDKRYAAPRSVQEIKLHILKFHVFPFQF